MSVDSNLTRAGLSLSVSHFREGRDVLADRSFLAVDSAQ